MQLCQIPDVAFSSRGERGAEEQQRIIMCRTVTVTFYIWDIKMSKCQLALSLLMLTLLRAVSPPSDPAAVAVGDSVRRGRQTHRLDQRAERGRPGLLQLQQGDVIVKRVCIVILVHHDPLDVRHVFGAALCQHAEVGAPLTWVGQSGGVRGSCGLNCTS